MVPPCNPARATLDSGPTCWTCQTRVCIEPPAQCPGTRPRSPRASSSTWARRTARNSWGDRTTPLRSPTWAKTLRRLPAEGYYVLPEELKFEGGGRWLKNAIVQLGYSAEGKGIVFVAEQRDTATDNAIYFSDRGMVVDDAVLDRLNWAPILPIRQ